MNLYRCFFYCLVISVLSLKIHCQDGEGFQLSRGEGWDPINQFNLPHFCACSKPGPGFPEPYIVVFYNILLFLDER